MAPPSAWSTNHIEQRMHRRLHQSNVHNFVTRTHGSVRSVSKSRRRVDAPVSACYLDVTRRFKTRIRSFVDNTIWCLCGMQRVGLSWQHQCAQYIEITCLNWASDCIKFACFKWAPALQLRHNEHDGVSNHQPHDCLLNRADERKHQSSASLAFVRRIHRGPVNTPRKWPVTREVFQFLWRHLDYKIRTICDENPHVKCNDFVALRHANLPNVS